MAENKRSWGILVLLIVNPLLIILYSDATFDSSSSSASPRELVESMIPSSELAPVELHRSSPAENPSQASSDEPEIEASAAIEAKVPREAFIEATRRSPASRSRSWQ